MRCKTYSSSSPKSHSDFALDASFTPSLLILTILYIISDLTVYKQYVNVKRVMQYRYLTGSICLNKVNFVIK